MFFRAVPYTDEADITACEPFDKMMLFASTDEGGDPEYVWDNIPAQAAREIANVMAGL